VGRLFWKIFIVFWLALLATAVATAAAVSLLRATRADAEPELASGMPARIATDLAASTLRHGGEAALRAWLGETGRTRAPALFAVDAEGADLLGRPVPLPALERARELAASGERPRAAREVSAPSGERYLLFAAASTEPRRYGRRAGAPQPWVLIVMGAVAGLAASALLAWYFARPIRSLRWAFRAAAEGRLDTRVRPLMKGRRDEIADLGEDFDLMAGQLQKLVAAQRRLLHDVSHELRSPLARLQAAIGLVRQDPSRLEGSLERIEREVTRLDTLVGEVLTLARLEGGTASGALETLDLADLVASVASDARFEAEASGRRLELGSADRVSVRGRAELLHRAVENVIRNAVKYTAEGTAVQVELATLASPPRALLTVRDQGPGVPAGELERIFEPFYRASGDPGAKGFGLGLAIAQAAVLSHHGSIRAGNADGGGLRVEIELALAEDGPALG
jgi:two-component system OmpR family sensor kinase